MKKILVLALLTTAACSVDSEPVPTPLPESAGTTSQAITHGQPDGNAHPAVVLLAAYENETRIWRCTSTLLNATTVLTAGHCVDAPANHYRVYTESDVEAGIVAGTNNYPNAGPNSVDSVAHFSHPLFDTNAFFLHDVAIVKLAAPGVVLPANQYGKLPGLNSLDQLAPRRSTQFTAVGYGLQKVNDGADHNAMQLIALKTRMIANPYLLQINTGFTGPQSLVLSNNAATGGTCFGDSGGPNFLGDSLVVGGVTSFGLNGSCGGTGGVFRVDRQDVLDFINAHMN